MLLFLQFGFPVGKSTGVSVRTLAVLFKWLAQLCLHLYLIVFRKDPPVAFEGERVLGLILSSWPEMVVFLQKLWLKLHLILDTPNQVVEVFFWRYIFRKIWVRVFVALRKIDFDVDVLDPIYVDLILGDLINLFLLRVWKSKWVSMIIHHIRREEPTSNRRNSIFLVSVSGVIIAMRVGLHWIGPIVSNIPNRIGRFFEMSESLVIIIFFSYDSKLGMIQNIKFCKDNQ